jgi:hypothetical protein
MRNLRKTLTIVFIVITGLLLIGCTYTRPIFHEDGNLC